MKKTFIGVLLLATAISTSVVRADPANKVGFRGWGPRVGLTIDPDQIHFGAHVDFGNFAEHIRFEPNLEVGVGDDLTVFAVNLDGHYRFASTWDVWTPYLGGGPGIFFVNVDSKGGNGDDSDTDLGVSVVGGVEKGLANGSRFFVESRLGLVDAPDWKFTAGWTFFH